MTGATAWVPNNNDNRGIRINGLPPPANILKNQATKLAPEMSNAMTVADSSSGTDNTLAANPFFEPV